MSKLLSLFLLPVLLFADVSKETALRGPIWEENAVMYAIFPRDFSPSGDFAGVTERLPQVKKLGATIIWLLPIHPVGQKMKKGAVGSPYSVQDYYAVNPSYGTKDDFKKLVMKAHELGLKVIIDGVLNHTSWDSVLMKNPDFYRKDENGQIIPPVADWYDVAALDYSNSEVRRYILDMLKYWLKEFDLDGFRMDASALVPLDFWEEVRGELHRIKRGILLLGEEDDPEALVKAFDMDYAWDFEAAINEVIAHGAPATSTLKDELAIEKARFPKGSVHLRFSDNHDKRRAIARFGEGGALAASALIFTMDGVPLIYNGMEIGDTSESAAPALFESIPIIWQSAELRPEFLPFYEKIIALRKKHPALRSGELIWHKNSEDSRIATYSRKSKTEEFLIAINFSNQPFTGTVDVEGSFENVMSGERVVLRNLSLNAWEFRILRR